ncbi:ComEA family DNA-binding protein [Bifidobacterium aemilianum]|nr:helix-hairpin-helix domain-containing protein [Bifidobacterium aemilianum]
MKSAGKLEEAEDQSFPGLNRGNDALTHKAGSHGHGLDLGSMVGVRPGDGRPQALLNARRHTPRLALRPIHALIAILVLVAALCASLTLLVQQSLNYAALDSHTAASASRAGKKERAGRQDQQTASGKQGQADVGQAGGQRAGEPSKEGNPAGQEDRQAGEDPSGSQSTQSADARIDLNTATVDQLTTIKGVGPVMASRIVQYRQRIGRFTSVDQLLEVDGIGAKTLDKLRPQTRV